MMSSIHLMLISMVTIVVGTNRGNSKSAELAKFYEESFNEKEISCQVLDLKVLPIDFIFTECFGQRSEEYAQILEKYVIKADKFVFVLPEYHGGFPGVVKSFLDSFSGDIIAGKHAALVGVSAGRAGNLRGLDAFAGVLGYMQVEVLANRPKLSNIEGILKGGVLANAENLAKVEKQIQQLIAIS